MLAIAHEDFGSPPVQPGLKKTLIAEALLIDGIRRGEPKVLTFLYNSYSSALFGIILRIVGCEEQAEDTLQDTFIKIWKSFDSYDASKGRLFTWMANTARNTAIDHVRSSFHRNNNDNEDVSEVTRIIDKKLNVTPNQETVGIREMTRTLKPEYQSIIDLIYFRGYTHTDAALELDIPAGTVKTRLRMAMKTLRKLFN